MIDLHSHILPKVDDGSGSIEETFALLKEAKEVGFTDILLTSHYMEDHYNMEANARKELIEALRAGVNKKNIDINIYPGMEVFVCPNMVELIEEGTICTLNNTRYILFELPRENKVIYLEELMFDLLGNGIVPIIAHPERYIFVQKNPNTLVDLIDQGALFQMNYASITGIYGKETKATAKKLLEHNMVHFLGSDVHRQGTIYKKMNKISKEIEKIIGKEQFKILSTVNPRHVINNEIIEINEPIPLKNKFKKV